MAGGRVSKRKRTKSKKNTYRKKMKASSSIKTDSTSYGNRRVKSMRSRKKKLSTSMATKVARLEKLFKKLGPNVSRGTVMYQEPFSLLTTSADDTKKTLWMLLILNRTKWESVCTEASGASVTNNEKHNIDYAHMKVILRNNEQCEVTIKIRWLKCVDSTDDSPITLIRSRMLDRGLPDFPESAGAVATIGSSSFVPPSCSNNGSAIVVPVIETQGISQYYKQIGKIVTATISPGDTFRSMVKIPAFVYKREDYVDATENYLKNMNYFCLIETMGALGHKTNSRNFIKISSYNLDCFYEYLLKASIMDDQGANNMSFTSAWDATGGTTVALYEKPVSGSVTV